MDSTEVPPDNAATTNEVPDASITTPDDTVNLDGPETISRVKQFYDLFRRFDMGPYSRNREHFYDEIELLVATGVYSANRIVKKAAQTAVKSHKCPFPWTVVEKFLFQILGRQHILLDKDGVPRDPNAISSFSKPIAGLKGDWRNILDAELLLFLAERDGKLNVRELGAVAYLMFPGLEDDEGLSEVEKLFDLLAHDQVYTDANGLIIVKKSSPKQQATTAPNLRIVESGDSASGAAA